MDETSNTSAEKRTNVYAAIGIGFVCVVIGLPLWWKTTEVYRVSLPYSDIETLADTHIEYAVDLNVISFVQKMSSDDLASMSKHLMEQLDAKPDVSVKSHYRTVVREAKADEKALIADATSITDLDTKLAGLLPSVVNTYYILLLPADGRITVSKPTIGLHRNAFVIYTGKDLTSFSSEIVQFVKQTLVRETTVVRGFNSAKGARELKPDKETLRSLRSSPGYDLTLTLVSPRPDITDPQWDIEAAVQTYLNPLLSKLEGYVKVDVKSQVLFFTKLQTKPKKSGDEFYFTSKDLPHMINPLEAKLTNRVDPDETAPTGAVSSGSTLFANTSNHVTMRIGETKNQTTPTLKGRGGLVLCYPTADKRNTVSPASTKPELNFIVYVPSTDQYPLYIQDEQGNKLSSNSFLSPQWGGIQIYNIAPPSVNDTLPAQPNLDMRKVMEVILSQLRLLLNLQTQVVDTVSLLPVGLSAVTYWELDSWLRSRCVENLATSTATLRSLAELLGKISNIVINDDIGNEVKTAVDAIPKSLQHLASGSLVKAFLESRKAIIASEKAFFDPSLLELLYFPEDQKFAIYIPLFLPISFPVLASLYQAYKWYKSSDKPKQE